MLVVISDLHFMDGTAGEHNLPAKAFTSVFLPPIVTLAKRSRAREIKLVLLGDIIDLIRTQKWLEEKPKDRPWGKNGLLDVPQPRAESRIEQCCLDILGRFPADGRKESVPKDTILYKNWETFEFFRNFQRLIHQELGADVPAEVIYVVGNHDRLCNLYPSVRDEVQRALGLWKTRETVDGDPAGEWWYRYDFMAPEYGVYARHGHQSDVINYAGGDDLTRRGHLQVPIGDVVSTEFAVNLPWTLRSMKDDFPDVTDQLVENLKEIDNVRPLRRIVEWFRYQIKREHSDEASRAMEKTFNKVITHLLNIDFVQQWRSPDTHLDELVRVISIPGLQWIPKAVLEIVGNSALSPILLPLVERVADTDKEFDDYAEAAYHEREWRRNRAIRYLLYGHTHQSLIRPLDVVPPSPDGEVEREVLYINTGTWRETIRRTVPQDRPGDFIKLKQITFVAFYSQHEDQDGKTPGTISFDVWTGYAKKSKV